MDVSSFIAIDMIKGSSFGICNFVSV